MSANIGFATLSVIPSLKGMDSKLRSQIGVSTGSISDQAGRTAGSRFSNSFGNGLRTLGKVGAIAFAGVGAAAIGAAGFGLKIAASMEQAQIGFETMLGSGAKAKAFLADLQQFAAKTPFEFPELQSAASSLISVGIETSKVIPIMTTLGNVTSGMGTGSEGVRRATIALQQMSAAGRITGEDLNQLRDAGIPVFDLLAAATGKSKAEVVKLAQAGKLGAKELGQLMKALETGKGLERFSGLMEKQSQSLSGMISTLKDTLGQGLARAATPLVTLAKDVLPELMGPFGEILDAFSEAAHSVIPFLAGALKALTPILFPIVSLFATVADRLAKVLLPVLAAITPHLGAFVEQLTQIFLALVPLLPPLGDLLVAIAPILPVTAQMLAILAQLIAEGLGPLIEVLAQVIKWVTKSKPVLIVLGIAVAGLLPIFGPVSAAIIGIALAIKGVMEISKHWGAILDFLKGIVGKVGGFFVDIGRKIGDFFSRIGPTLLKIAAGIGVAVVAILFPPALIIGALVKWHNEIFAFFRALPGRILGFINQGLQTLIAGVIVIGIRIVQGLITGFVAYVKFVIEFWTKLPGRILAALGAIGSFLLNAGRALLTGFLNGVKASVGFYLDFFRRLPGRALGALGALGRFLFAAGRDLLNGMGTGIKAVVGSLLGFFRDLPGRIVKALGNLGKILFEAGKKILGGLVDGVKSALGGVKDFFGGIGKKIGEWKGPLDKDRKMLIPQGRAIMQSLIAGVAAEEDRLRDQLARVSGIFTSIPADVTMRVRAEGPVVAPVRPTRESVGVRGTHIEQNLTINNPKPEPLSFTVPYALRRMKMMAER
jgi:tape measure domain-containing protein